MIRPFVTIGNSLEMIVAGARLLAAGDDLDANTMEQLVRKAARIAREAMLQEARAARANDEEAR